MLPQITPTTTVTPSERSVRTSGSAKPAAVPPSNASQRSVAPSQRSAAPSQNALAQGVSERSHRSQGSTRSISSSVALGKLVQLEKMLHEERNARENAENTMLQLQRERIVRDEATRRQVALERQLESVMSAVKHVVSDPENPGNIRKLKAVLQGGSTSATPSERNAVNSDGRPRSFLDGVGQYERDRDKARKAAKAGAQAPH